MRPAILTSYEVVFFVNMTGDDSVLRIGCILEIGYDGQTGFVWFSDPAYAKWVQDGVPGVGFEEINFETWPELRRPSEYFDGLCQRAKTEGIVKFLQDFDIPSALYIYKDTSRD